jgi:hypothetical protein
MSWLMYLMEMADGCGGIEILAYVDILFVLYCFD